MLAELSIENFAIIDRLLVRFAPGLTVLTGETGAGKSIIIDALQAALGGRVTADVVRAGGRSASIEAVFEAPEFQDDDLNSLLDENGLDAHEGIILRREVSVAGRGTSRVNGRALPLAVLQAIGSRLVDIHGQSEHLSILRRDRQLEALDRYGELLPLRASVSEAITGLQRVNRELSELLNGQREAEQRLDLLRFQVDEIESARLTSGEEEDLLAERNVLANAERLTELADMAHERLHGEAGSAADVVGEAIPAVENLSGIDPTLSALSERLQAAHYELEDVAQELRRYRDSIEFDPRRLAEVEERLDLLARLRRKYGSTLDEVIRFGLEARTSMEDVQNLDERIAELSAEQSESETRAGRLAGDLSMARVAAAKRLSAAMQEALRGLGLKGTNFLVEVSQAPSESGLCVPGSDLPLASFTTGVDTVAFLASFNPGEPLRPLERVASGGETSRFLLALKSVLASADRTPTLVFDEIDVGVGARHGMVVGERLRELSRSHQVLSITHLPQIAALADEHLRVAKAVSSGRVTAEVHVVESGERVLEIAEMMSGTGTETARRTAAELLERAQRKS